MFARAYAQYSFLHFRVDKEPSNAMVSSDSVVNSENISARAYEILSNSIKNNETECKTKW
jgi:hypothetical protein